MAHQLNGYGLGGTKVEAQAWDAGDLGPGLAGQEKLSAMASNRNKSVQLAYPMLVHGSSAGCDGQNPEPTLDPNTRTT